MILCLRTYGHKLFHLILTNFIGYVPYPRVLFTLSEGGLYTPLRPVSNDLVGDVGCSVLPSLYWSVLPPILAELIDHVPFFGLWS